MLLLLLLLLIDFGLKAKEEVSAVRRRLYVEEIGTREERREEEGRTTKGE